MDVEKAVNALRPLPFVSGEVLVDEPEVVKLRSAAAILEIPRRFITERRDDRGMVELTLARDAVIVVSTVVSARKGFVAADVFGGLHPGIVSDNCNCNCNCNTGNCNCNCNCGNCDCGGSGCAGGGVMLEQTPIDARRFRRGSAQNLALDVTAQKRAQ